MHSRPVEVRTRAAARNARTSFETERVRRRRAGRNSRTSFTDRTRFGTSGRAPRSTGRTWSAGFSGGRPDPKLTNLVHTPNQVQDLEPDPQLDQANLTREFLERLR